MAEPESHRTDHDDDGQASAEAEVEGALIDLEELVGRWSEEAAIEEQVAEALGGARVEWISLGEAEAAAGVSRSTLRAWYRSGRIPSRLMPGPHGLQRLVPRDAVVAQAALSPRTGARPVAGGEGEGSGEDADRGRRSSPGPSDDLARLAELAVSEARARADAAEARAEAAEAALRAALERAAAAEAELRVLRDKA